MSRLMVTGASGLLGANLVLEASANHDVVAISNMHRMRFEHARTLQVDLTREGDVKDVFDDVRPSAVIHCAAGTEIDDLEQKPQLAMLLNSEMAGHLARAAKKHSARFIHISTDAVFDGITGHYSELDVPEPRNVYGRSKLAGEVSVQEEHPQALVIRTNIFGWSPGWRNNLAEWFIEGLESGAEVPGFEDIHFSPILVNDLARCLLALVDHDAHGVLHIPGADCVSKYEFGIRIARALSLVSDRVKKTTSSRAGFVAPRPMNTCLQGEKAQTLLGIQLPSIDEGIRELFVLRNHGYLDQLRATREEDNE